MNNLERLEADLLKQEAKWAEYIRQLHASNSYPRCETPGCDRHALGNVGGKWYCGRH